MTRDEKLAQIREWLIELTEDSSLVAHAESEIGDWGREGGGNPNGWMYDVTMDIVRLFCTQGHSGSSAPFAIAVFKTLANWEPWGPLTGDDDEWMDIGDGICFQNRRCSHVFKDSAQGEAYDIQGKIFREPNGVTFTNIESRTPVTFPYKPTSEFVDVEAST